MEAVTLSQPQDAPNGSPGLEWINASGYCPVPPKWVILGINNVCNLKCKMCDVGLGARDTVFWANLISEHPQNMPLELLQEIVRQAGDFHPRPRFGLAFTEPLIHPRLLDFVRTIVTEGFYCTVTSNGTTLARVAESLVEIGLDDLCISIDGPEAVHNRIRGGRETFQKLYQGIERLNAAKRRRNTLYPTLNLSFTITDENYGHILEFLRQVEPLRPDHINISQMNFITEAMAAAHNARYGGELAVVRSNLGAMEPADFDTAAIAAELARVRAYAAARGPDFPALSIVPDSADPIQMETYYRQPHLFVGGRQCTDPWKMLMVKTDGTVIPAHGRCYNVPVGNVRETPLVELWNSPRFVAFRKTLQAAGGTLPACARCCGIIGKKKAGH